MFTNTHVYFTNKVVSGRLTYLNVIGSFLPDLALMQIIGWDDLHNQKTIDEFKEHLMKTKPEYADLGEGISYHFLLDEITHKQYKDGTGYAYQSLTPELIQLVSKAFSIEDESTAKTIAHNVIEIAVDSFVLDVKPDLLGIIKAASNEVNVSEMSDILASFFKLDLVKVKNALERYFVIMTKYDTRNLDQCVNLCEEINQLLFKKSVDPELIKQAILKSRTLVKDTYSEFLESSIAQHRQ